MVRNIFSKDNFEYDGKLPVDPGSLNHRVTGLDDQFRGTLDALASRSDLTLQANMFSDADYELKLKFRRRNGEYDVYYGLAGNDSDSDVVLTTDGKIITLSVHHNDRGFQVVPLEEGIYLIEEINLDLHADCGVHSDEYDDDDQNSSTETVKDEQEYGVGSVGSSNIKILILYTSDVREELNDTSEGVEGFLRQTVEDFNLALEKSNIDAFITYAALEKNVEGLPNGYCAIAKAMKSNKTISDLRTEYNADLVSIIRTPKGRSCAICLGSVNGNRMSAFSAVNLSQARQRYSFIHEIGHNLGAAHNPGTDNPGYCAESTALGNSFRVGTTLYGTIMSYDGIRILRFSGLDVSYKGVTTGTPDRNNAGTIRKVVSRAASYAESFNNV